MEVLEEVKEAIKDAHKRHPETHPSLEHSAWVLKVEVEHFKCSRCGKTKKVVRVFGKLSKKVAEDIIDNSTGVVNNRYVAEELPEPEVVTLTTTEDKQCKKKAA